MRENLPLATVTPILDPRWRAVLAHDRESDEKFVYGVKTTGIYCRPSCAARRPLSINVCFFNDPVHAEQHGFRPCKRCKPAEASAIDQSCALIAKICRAIERDDETPSLTHLAAREGLSASHLHRLFKSRLGLTPKAYASAVRANRIQTRLRLGQGSITQAIYAAGFNSGGRFYDQAQKILGMTPQAFRANGQGEIIGFALRPCRFGLALAASGSRGVCAIVLGDDRHRLIAALKADFKRAHSTLYDVTLEKRLARAIWTLEENVTGPEVLPLEFRQTAFSYQLRQALNFVAYGSDELDGTKSH